MIMYDFIYPTFHDVLDFEMGVVCFIATADGHPFIEPTHQLIVRKNEVRAVLADISDGFTFKFYVTNLGLLEVDLSNHDDPDAAWVDLDLRSRKWMEQTR